jgi:hypothetical protein
LKTKEILYEWKQFLNENRIIPLAELLGVIRANTNYSESDVQNFTDFWNANQFSSKYSQVIKNDLEKGEPIEHITDAVTAHYHKVYQSAGPQIRSDIGSGTYSVDDLRKDLDDRLGANRFNKTEIRQQCQYENGRPVVGKYNDFDVVYSESDWVVIEPKTILGSIAWAHGKPDGSEETDQSRRVGWCTATSSVNNMFMNYAGNLHMFYLIRSDYDSVDGPERRICLSYMVKGGKAVLYFDVGATVDANNKSLSKSRINSLVNKNILNLITSLVSTRKETSASEIYSKITVSQLKRQIAQMKSQRVNPDLIQGELNNYAQYTKSKDVVDYILSISYEYENVRETIASREDLLKIDPEGELIRQLANDDHENVRSAIASRKDLLKIDSEGEIISQLASDEDQFVRAILAYRKDLLEADPSGEIISQLASDEDTSVRVAIARREDLLELDPEGELIKQLASDENQYVRVAIAERKDLLELDPEGELISQLASDDHQFVRAAIASRKDLLDVDRELVIQLASDDHEYVRALLANSKDLLKIDPSGELIKQLANDENARRYILSNKKYSEFLNKKTNESILRNYIKLMMS